MVRLGPEPPALLLAGHLEGEAPVLVYRVPDLARVPSTGDAVACCYPRWRPASYHVWVAPDDWYRLRVGLVRSAWTLRDDDRVQVASFAIGREGLPDRIQTATDATRIRQLGLLVMVSLEAILRQPNVPAEVGGAGG